MLLQKDELMYGQGILMASQKQLGVGNEKKKAIKQKITLEITQHVSNNIKSTIIPPAD